MTKDISHDDTPPPSRVHGLDMQFLREFKRDITDRFDSMEKLVASIGNRVSTGEQDSAVERYKLTVALRQIVDLEKDVTANGKRIAELESAGKMHWAVRLLLEVLLLAAFGTVASAVLKPWGVQPVTPHIEVHP